MKRTHRSLYYLVTYLVFAGLALMVAPGFALRLLLSNGDYGDVLPRLLGVVLLALGILIFRIVQLRLEALYPTTLIVRAIILATLAGLYLYARDPFFLVLIGVVGLGVVLTGLSYWRDRQGS